VIYTDLNVNFFLSTGNVNSTCTFMVNSTILTICNKMPHVAYVQKIETYLSDTANTSIPGLTPKPSGH